MGASGSAEVAEPGESSPVDIGEVNKNESSQPIIPPIPTPEDESRDDPAAATKKKTAPINRSNSNSIVIDTAALEG